MSNILKNKQLILKVMLIILFLAISIIISCLNYGDYTNLRAEVLDASYDAANITIDIEIRIGEEYDITEHINDAKALLNKKALRGVHGVFNFQVVDPYNRGIIDLDNRTVRGNKSGFTTITYDYRYYSQFYGNALFPSNAIIETIPLLELNIIVLDLKENYIPVSSIGDLSYEYRTYILMNDIIVDDSTQMIHSFEGVFINPNNYTITFTKESGKRRFLFMNWGYIKGLIFNLDVDMSGNEDLRVPTINYIADSNNGIITDSLFNINIIAKDIEAIGIVDENYCIKNCTITAHFTVLEGGSVTFIVSKYVSNTTLNYYKNNNVTITIDGDTSSIGQPSDYMIDNNSITIIIEEENN